MCRTPGTSSCRGWFTFGIMIPIIGTTALNGAFTMSSGESKNQNGDTAPPAPIGAAVDRRGWVQTERAAHQAWAVMWKEKPTAAAIMHHLVALMDKRGAVVISQKALAKIAGYCERATRNAIKDLESRQWLQVVRLGPGTTCAYVINDRVAWADRRENLRLSTFSATVIADYDDQDSTAIESAPLRRIPVLYPGEQQLPAGDYEPPAQAVLDGMETDLPAVSGS